MDNRRTLVSSLLTLAAIGLLVATFYSPIWWVSLTAPNYPPEAFPDGVRIHFHMNGVFNGCKKIEKAEITEDIALDCVHEMDTINHYVGMYPIAAGGPVEISFAPFLFFLLGIMLLGFIIQQPKLRMAIMSVGFAGIAAWMSLAWYGADGLKYQSAGYIHALVTAMDQDTDRETGTQLNSGQALIERLKEELGEYYVPPEGLEEEETKEEADDEKSANINHLRGTFEKDMERRPVGERQHWDGSGRQMLTWHYQKNLGRYFNNPEEIKPLTNVISIAAAIMFWGILAAMVLLVLGARKNSGLLYWLLILVPIGLPLFFLLDYAAWLWWYGHNLNAMGAFTVKPFMPTVFGQGKVAQFATHSYPAIGYGLMMVASVLLSLAALIRRKQQQEEG